MMMMVVCIQVQTCALAPSPRSGRSRVRQQDTTSSQSSLSSLSTWEYNQWSCAHGNLFLVIIVKLGWQSDSSMSQTWLNQKSCFFWNLWAILSILQCSDLEALSVHGVEVLATWEYDQWSCAHGNLFLVIIVGMTKRYKYVTDMAESKVLLLLESLGHP